MKYIFSQQRKKSKENMLKDLCVKICIKEIETEQTHKESRKYN